MATMERHNITIPAPLWRRIEAEAKRLTDREGQRVSASEVIRRAVEEKIERDNSEAESAWISASEIPPVQISSTVKEKLTRDS